MTPAQSLFLSPGGRAIVENREPSHPSPVRRETHFPMREPNGKMTIRAWLIGSRS